MVAPVLDTDDVREAEAHRCKVCQGLFPADTWGGTLSDEFYDHIEDCVVEKDSDQYICGYCDESHPTEELAAQCHARWLCGECEEYHGADKARAEQCCRFECKGCNYRYGEKRTAVACCNAGAIDHSTGVSGNEIAQTVSFQVKLDASGKPEAADVERILAELNS